MNKVSLRLLTIATCCAITANVYADDKRAEPTIQQPLNVGVWEMFTTLSSSDEGKLEQTRVTTLQAEKASKLEAQRQESAKKLTEFNAKKDTLSKEARDKQEQELLALSRDLQNEVQKAQELVRHEMNRATEKLARDAEKAAIEVAKAEDLDVLLEKNTGRVIWSKDNFDVTSKVTAKMNENHKIALAQNKQATSKTTTVATNKTPLKGVNTKA